MAEDRWLDVRSGAAQSAVAGPIDRLEQGGAHAGEDSPVGLKVIKVAIGNSAAKVSGDVLQILSLAAVDVARQVEVEVVLRVADLGQWYASVG